MQKKWLFLQARFFIFLMLAGVGFGLAVPEVAQAHDGHDDPTIEWIRIYEIPESSLVDRGTTSNGWPPANFQSANPGGHYDTSTSMRGHVQGYVPIESDGRPRGGIAVTADTVLGVNDILGIAIRVGPVNAVNWRNGINLSGWDTEGPTRSVIGGYSETRRYLNHNFGGSQLALPAGQLNLPKFTLLYLYRVQAGDLDLDGGWFPNNFPFTAESGVGVNGHNYDASTLLTFDTSQIVYPQIESIRPLLSYPTFDPPFSGWNEPYRINGNLNPAFNLPPGSRWVQDGNSPYTITSTPQGTDPESRFAAFYETCFYVWHNAGRPDLGTSQGQETA